MPKRNSEPIGNGGPTGDDATLSRLARTGSGGSARRALLFGDDAPPGTPCRVLMDYGGFASATQHNSFDQAVLLDFDRPGGAAVTRGLIGVPRPFSATLGWRSAENVSPELSRR